jgi:hypothetical protein
MPRGLATGLLILPVGISAVLMGAHVLRDGHLEVAVLCVLAPWLLLVRHPAMARLVQAGLVLAAAEWVRTLASLAATRAAMGEPWGRMAAILGAVVLFTLTSAAVFTTGTLRERYRLNDGED